MKQRIPLLTFTLAVATTLAAAQMRPGTPAGPGGTMGQPGTARGQQIPGMGEPGMGGTSGIPGQDQQQQQTSTPAVDDGTLERQVHQEFTRNPDMADVQVQVEKGVVTLQGSVPSKEDKKKAKQIAESVPGVRKVREKLTVKPGGASASTSSDNLGISTGSDTARNAEQQNNTSGSIAGNTTAASGTEAGTSAMGQAGASTSSAPSTNPGTTPSGETRGSATPETVSPGTSNPGSTVPATPPTASISGASGNIGAASGAQLGAAVGGTATEQSASSGEFNTVPDSKSLQGQIETSLKSDPTLTNQNVSVNVTPDTIELSGNVPTGKEKQTARRIAESYAASRKVIDHITIAGRGQSSTSANTNSSESRSEGSSRTGDITGAPGSSGPGGIGNAGAAGTTGTTAGSATGTENSTTGTPTPPRSNPPR